MGRFNLLQEPWIAVVDGRSGKMCKVSLLDLFRNAENYQTLAGEMQTQNFAILRFLLAVVQTVFSRYDCGGNLLPGIELDEYGRQKKAVDEDDLDDYCIAVSECWEQLYSAGRFPEIVVQYLKNWQERFYLFDENYPFYQVNKNEMDKILNDISRTDATGVMGRTINRTISESGNKPALFTTGIYGTDKSDNPCRPDILSADELARWMITYQGYSSTSEKAKLPKDCKTPSKGWLYDIGGIYLLGNSLFETLMMNYIPEFSKIKSGLTGRVQKPCWEYSGSEIVHRLCEEMPVDNLAELYTNWSRAIYIDPEAGTDTLGPIQINVVKLPEIDHSVASIEPMTLWKTVKINNKESLCVLKKHEAGKALWRSFGLIAANPDSSDSSQRQAGIYSQYERIARVKGSRWTDIVGVSMKDDGNAASWTPVDEITDQFRINDLVFTDHDPDGWIVRITNAVETTKDVASGIFRRYLLGICEIRNLKLKAPIDPLASGFIEAETESLYDDIDTYFKHWLEFLRPETSKDRAISQWYARLKQLALKHAEDLFNNCTEKDLIGIEGKYGCENIATKYWLFINQLNKKLGKEKIRDNSGE